jgi:hypothetical protein
MSVEAVRLVVTPGAIERLTAVDRPSLVVSVSPPPEVPCPPCMTPQPGSTHHCHLPEGHPGRHETNLSSHSIVYWHDDHYPVNHTGKVNGSPPAAFIPLPLPWVGAQLVVPCPCDCHTTEDYPPEYAAQLRIGCSDCDGSGSVVVATCTVITCERADQEWSDEKNDTATPEWRYEVTDVVACDRGSNRAENVRPT